MSRVHRQSFATDTERFALYVYYYGACNGKGQHKRWTHQKIGTQIGMDAGLEIPVAGTEGLIAERSTSITFE